MHICEVNVSWFGCLEVLTEQRAVTGPKQAWDGSCTEGLGLCGGQSPASVVTTCGFFDAGVGGSVEIWILDLSGL